MATVVYKGVYSHTDKYGAIWFTITEPETLETLQKRDPLSISRDKTCFKVKAVGRNKPVGLDCYGSSVLKVTVKRTAYKFSDAAGRTRAGSRLVLVDIERVVKFE